jgi:hypothetical protein
VIKNEVPRRTLLKALENQNLTNQSDERLQAFLLESWKPVQRLRASRLVPINASATRKLARS